jgi:hypothetical protein
MSNVGKYTNVSTSGYWQLGTQPSFANDFRATYAVYKLSSLATGQTWTVFGTGGNGYGYAMQYFIQNSNSTYFIDLILSANVFLPVIGYIPYSATTLNPSYKFYTHSLVWGSNAGSSYTRVGGTYLSALGSPNWSPDYGIGFYNPCWIGYGSNPAQPSGITMSICEFMMIDGTMTSADQLTIENWLNTRWGSGVN